MAQSFPHSGREAGREDILPRDVASVGPRWPHNTHTASALQNLLGAKNYQGDFRKIVPTPKKTRVSCP